MRPSAQTKSKASDLKRIVGLVMGCASVVAFYLMPAMPDLSHDALTSIGVLLGAVFMWFCGSMPTGVVGVLACLMLFVLGVVPSFEDAFVGFVSQTTWFVLAVFCMTAFMQMSTLGARLTKRFIQLAGADSRKLVFAVMAATALCSAIMTDTGAVALTMGFASAMLGVFGHEPGTSNLGKCLMMGVSLGALIGGFTTPIGHSLNVLAMGILESQTGYTIPFAVWMCYGVPIACLMLPVAWRCLVRFFPPEDIRQEDVDALMATKFSFGKMTRHDVKCLVLLVALPVLWVAGNWVSWLGATVVALVGFVLLFAPGIDVLAWDRFEALASWNLFLFFGGVLSIGGAISSTGAAAWIGNELLASGIMGLPTALVLLIVAVILYFLQTVCPIAPSWVAIFLPPLLVYAQATGLPLTAPTFMIVCLIAGSYLVPLAPAMNMTLDTGYYRFSDTLRVGWVPSAALIAAAVGWTYLLSMVIGVA